MSGEHARVTHRPGRLLEAGALGAAVVSAAIAAPASPLSLLAGVVGVVAVVVGVTSRVRRIATLGVYGVLGCVLTAGAAGLPVHRLLVAMAGTVLAWEFSTSGFAMAEELDGGTVERTEALHVVAATVAAAFATGLAYAAYRTLTVGVSTTAATLLLVAVVSLGLALRE